jgi:hypothetical protein
MSGVGSDFLNPTKDPAWGVNPLINVVGVLPKWQVSHFVLLPGMCPPGLVAGSTTMLAFIP